MMRVHRNLEALPGFVNAVVTIGTFDGVHAGHQKILQQLRAEAEKAGGETVIITFHPHPRRVVSHQQSEIRLLNTLDEKITLLDAAGIDHLVIVPFTTRFSEMPAHDYVRDFLVKYFSPHTLIIGYDHRFGHQRTGDYALLEKLGQLYHFRVTEIPKQLISENAVSSTLVRQAIINGDIREANAYLGYAFFFEGTVVEGNQLGRTIGFPTANLQLNDQEKLTPGNGVYAVEAELIAATPLPANAHAPLPPKRLIGMMNIGVRPTVDGTKRVIEVHLFDFDADIYGHTLRVYVHLRLRGEEKFSSLDQLKAQLAKDRNEAKILLNHLKTA